MIPIENQTKYGLTKEVSVTIILLKKWLKDNDIEMYSIHDEGKSVVAERIIKTLKTEIYKYMTQKMCISINQMTQWVSIIIHTIEQLR